jgi:NAD+--dinitrogen-reductase ADP-D-ribosyltransferase
VVNDKPKAGAARLPTRARLPVNRCNLPAEVLGSLSFQQHPVPLVIDGIAESYPDLFERLHTETSPGARAELFMDYLTVHFRLNALEDAGLRPGQPRANADYVHMLRGWLFDSDRREGAVLKGWVESRFGLLPRHHAAPLRDPQDPAWQVYLAQRSAGLYATNALEAQLDLVYSYCQYELLRQQAGNRTLLLYRGSNRLDEYEVVAEAGAGRRVLLLNNLNSFSASRERADEFGDYVFATEVPRSKIFYYSNLLPGRLHGEDEHLVIGGLYLVQMCI